MDGTLNGWGPVRQVAYVTRDMQRSLSHYVEALGVGPWFSTEQAVIDRCRYRGAPCAMNLTAALAYWGSIQVELLQQNNDAPSVFLDWGAGSQAREIHHHVAYWVDDYTEAIKSAERRGFSVVQDGLSAWGPFAYLLHPDAPHGFIEFTASTPERRAFQAAIAAAAADWRGERPYRSFANAVDGESA